eukprot:scaffold95179_cov78-Phaeocystis_antarctica.AAC.1
MLWAPWGDPQPRQFLIYTPNRGDAVRLSLAPSGASPTSSFVTEGVDCTKAHRMFVLASSSGFSEPVPSACELLACCSVRLASFYAVRITHGFMKVGLASGGHTQMRNTMFFQPRGIF